MAELVSAAAAGKKGKKGGASAAPTHTHRTRKRKKESVIAETNRLVFDSSMHCTLTSTIHGEGLIEFVFRH